MPYTEETVGIIWDGEDVPGIDSYGLWNREGVDKPGGMTAPDGSQWKDFRLVGPGWTVWNRSIRMTAWPRPNQWASFVRAALDDMIAAGAALAWCGLEGCFADPPSLFEPAHTGDGVYAVLSPEHGFVCTTQLNQAYRALERSELVQLNRCVRELLGARRKRRGESA